MLAEHAVHELYPSLYDLCSVREDPIVRLLWTQSKMSVACARVGTHFQAASYLNLHACLQDPIHRLPAMLVSAFDVTGQKELEVDLQQARQQLLRQVLMHRLSPHLHSIACGHSRGAKN